MSRKRFRPMFSHLRMNLFVRRTQELLLPEQAATAYICSEWPMRKPQMTSGIHKGLQASTQLHQK